MATTLSRDEVLRVAELARLELSDDEIATFGRQLADIIEWVNAIRQADTSGIEPTAGLSAAAPGWRDDTETASLERSRALESAPDTDADRALFRVPTVL